MTTIKTYKGQAIDFSEYDGRFSTTINGLFKKFSSLKSAMNAIDKATLIQFEPVEVLVMDSEGWSPAIYSVRQVKLVGYREAEGWKRGVLNRFYIVEGDDRAKDIRIESRTEIYDLKDKAKLEEMAKTLTEQSKIEHDAEAKQSKINERLGKMTVNHDPRPDMGY